MLLFSITSTIELLAQPVVQVPSTCEVIVAGSGTGAATGLGGKVGHGGIVLMPDPFDVAGASGDFIITTNGVSISGWSLGGDLSFQTSSGLIASAGSGLTQNIESFNKNPRANEGVSPSSSTLARSKGRVTISFVQSPCGGSISFEVYKTYPNTGSGAGYVPPIVGPSCWTPSQVVTYSVDPIATDNLMDGIAPDKYYWRISNGTSSISNAYMSSDESSITFTTPSTITGSWVVTCCYGRANPWDGNVIPFNSHTTCVTKSIGTPAAAPTFSTAPPTCLKTGVTSFTATVNAVPGLSYAWAYNATGGGSVAVSGTQGQTVTVSGLNNNPGQLVLTVTNTAFGCNADVFTYNVNRTLVSPLALTSTPSAPCMSPGGTVVLSLPTDAQANATTWTLPSGWTYSPSNAAASIIVVTVPVSANTGTYTISAASTSCTSSSISTTVTVKPLPVWSTGPACIVYGSTAPQAYAVTVPGAGPYTYSWALPSGWSGSSTTNSIAATPNGSSVGAVSVTVCYAGCCTTMTQAVDFSPVPPSISLSPKCFDVGLPGVSNMNVNNVAPFGAYSWVINSSFGTPATASGTGILVNTIGTPGTVSPAVTITHATASCGSSSNSFPITLTPNSTMTLINMGGMEMLQLSAFVVPYINIIWLGDCGLATEYICGTCGNAPQTMLTNPMGAGSWGALVFGADGCVTRHCTTTTYGARMAQGGIEEKDPDRLDEQAVTLSPNPNGGAFELHVENVKAEATMDLFDANGKFIHGTKLKAGTNTFNDIPLANGVYHLYIRVDGKYTIKKMEVIR